MVVLTCPCLNVKITIKELGLDSATDVDRSCLSPEIGNDEFFSNATKLVHVTSGGCHQEHKCLVQKRLVGGWRLYRCIVCDTDTHAVQSRASDHTMLVNASLIADPNVVDRIHSSSNFSPAFRVILKDTTTALQMSPACSLDFLPYIQQEATSYAMAGEAAMEDRIRKFEQEERTKFAALEIQLKSDKKKMISLVLQNSKDNLNMLSPSKKSLSHSMSTPIHMDGLNGNPQPPKITPDKNRPYPNNPDLLLDNDDELFHMDRYEEYEMSEDDAPDTDDSSAIERSSSPGLFSTSIPVNVPAWRGKNSPPLLHEDAIDENDAPGIDQIHANIQALARSVHDSSTQIFGDLPRPRLHTFSGRQSYR